MGWFLLLYPTAETYAEHVQCVTTDHSANLDKPHPTTPMSIPIDHCTFTAIIIAKAIKIAEENVLLHINFHSCLGMHFDLSDILSLSMIILIFNMNHIFHSHHQTHHNNWGKLILSKIILSISPKKYNANKSWSYRYMLVQYLGLVFRRRSDERRCRNTVHVPANSKYLSVTCENLQLSRLLAR